MRLLVDSRWYGSTGIGRYAKEILQRVPPGNTIENLSKTWAIKNPVTPYLLGLEINRIVPDLFWSPGFIPPLNSRVPYIVTVHDLIHLYYGGKLHVIYYNQIIRPLLRKAALILTVSEYSRRDILDWSGVPPEKVVSVYNAASKGYASEGLVYKPGYQYLLYVGNKRSHKNLKRLIIAFSRAELPDDIKLVFTGDTTKELSELVDKLKIPGRIVFLGFVAEENLPSVYRGALAVILVSLYEGFGIPIIEGMACSIPVLASNTTAMPEIAGGAALLVDPMSVDQITTGIERIVNDKVLRTDLIYRGKIRSQQFSWDDTAANVWRLFASVSK